MDLFGERLRAEIAEALYESDAALCQGDARGFGPGNYELYRRNGAGWAGVEGNTYERHALVAMKAIQAYYDKLT